MHAKNSCDKPRITPPTPNIPLCITSDLQDGCLFFISADKVYLLLLALFISPYCCFYWILLQSSFLLLLELVCVTAIQVGVVSALDTAGKSYLD